MLCLQVTSLPFFLFIMCSCCTSPCVPLVYFTFVFAPFLLFSVSVSHLGILCSSFVKTIYDIFCLQYEYILAYDYVMFANPDRKITKHMLLQELFTLDVLWGSCL